MTTPILQRTTVLVLNRRWFAIDAITPAEAFGHLACATARALRIDGDSIQAFGWDDWRALPPGSGDAVVGTPRGPVRIPTVIVLARFDRVPVHRPKFGFRALWERDGGRCQYSGRRLSPGEANIDHVLPRSRGGRDEWTNCVLSDRAINTRKGARTPAEAGLQLVAPPRVPRPVPATQRIRNHWNVPDWNHFLNLSA
ncbi:HNH endonuclease [Luteolibacter marinus]|uniref:HNH endonuclease n=1 Tax=Luteolibacter marinus TaxID=2776705 RepID=UPI0018675DE6|nr:HNH endonuclease [Luteolibacter marinus]